MKKQFKILLFTLLAPLFVGCDFLEPEALSLIERDKVYANLNYCEMLITRMYSYLPDGYGNGWNTSGTDESEAVSPESSMHVFNMGKWNQYSNPDSFWGTPYEVIRMAHDFLEGTAGLTWEEYRYSDPIEYERRVALTNQFRSEARFMRAFFYFELMKRYGGVPLIDHKLNLENGEDNHYITHAKRNSVEDCVNFIVGDCDTAALALPIQFDAARFGHVTSATCKALKARVLLYAASDLYNQEGRTAEVDDCYGYVDVSAAARQERWIRAAKAAKDVLDLNHFALHPDYRDLFLLGSTMSNEVIFSRLYSPSLNFTINHYPVSYDKGETVTCPSQNMVDAFEMTDGTKFDWEEFLADPNPLKDPYANRDPRLRMSVTVNGDVWAGRSVQIFEGGADALPNEHATKTGYYLKKWVADNMDALSGKKVARQWIFFRLGEVYLNYAEAMLEATQNPTAILPEQGLTMSAKDAMQKVRNRAGVGMPSVEETDPTLFRERLRNERRVELCFEGHRWWDVRRWMIGEEFQEPLRGVKIKKDRTVVDEHPEVVFTYTPFVVEDRVFDTSKMYLYPISVSEINKTNGEMIQNPGW